MPTGQMSQAVQHLRRAVLWGDGAGLSDGQLLDHFIERRDEAAFETLVRRHGPMVLGVCRRLLRNYHDADDAFQATFLVLVRKAASVAPREMVGNWLYGVAYQTALKGRAVAARRRAQERQVTVMPEPSTNPQADGRHGAWQELRSVLDQELSRLPSKYRVPFVLCDLEGKSYKEAARQLAWPEGTFSVRLARARQMLAKRLTRHGFSITGAALAAVVSEQAASACVPPSMISSTIKAASLLVAGQVAAGVVSGEVAALTKGVLKSMLLTKVKTAMAVVVTMSVVGLGGGALSYSLLADEAAAPKGQQEKSSAGKQVGDGAKKKGEAQTDQEKLQGIWKLVRVEALGTAWRGAKFADVGNLGIKGNQLFSPDREIPESSWHGTFRLDPRTNPKRITIEDEGPDGKLKFNGIYSIDQDELKLCLSDGPDIPFPTEFKTKEGSPYVLTTFQRGAIKQVEVAGKQKSAAGVADTPRKVERFNAGGFESMRGFDFRGIVVEKTITQYHVECTVVKVDPSGSDLGADGKGKILAQPVLIVPEGKENRILLGGQQAVPTGNNKAVEFLDFGLSVRVKVMGLTEKGVRLETVLEKNEVESADQNDVLVSGNKVRSITYVEVGKAVKLVEKDDRGEARYWVRVKPLRIEFVVPRAAPTKEDGKKNTTFRGAGQEYRADGNKRPSFQEIAQRLGLSEINQFMFAEAVYGYTDNRDAVPSISDLARDFGMKEIDVFLLIEALRRDAADKENGAGPQSTGFKSGGDLMFRTSQEYQIPVKANDQQQFKFWVGFFGH